MRLIIKRRQVKPDDADEQRRRESRREIHPTEQLIYLRARAREYELPRDILLREQDQRQGAGSALMKATKDELEAIIRLRSHPHYSTIEWELSAIIDGIVDRTVSLGDDYIKDQEAKQ